MASSESDKSEKKTQSVSNVKTDKERSGEKKKTEMPPERKKKTEVESEGKKKTELQSEGKKKTELQSEGKKKTELQSEGKKKTEMESEGKKGTSNKDLELEKKGESVHETSTKLESVVQQKSEKGTAEQSETPMAPLASKKPSRSDLPLMTPEGEEKSESEEGEAEVQQLRGCGNICFAEGAYNRAFRPRWAHGPQHFLAIFSFLMSFYQLFTFPVLITAHDPVAFLIAYLTWQLLVGIPILTYEIMLGQFSALSYAAAIRRMTPIFEGFGWTAIFFGFILLVKYVPVLGWAFYYLMLASLPVTDTSGTCPPGRSYCYDLQAARRCQQQNASYIYYKGSCLTSNEQITDGDTALLNHIEHCVTDQSLVSFPHYYRLKSLYWWYDMGQQKDPTCGLQLEFDPCVLAKTPWFNEPDHNYTRSPFLQYYAPCGDEGWKHVGWYPYRKSAENMRKEQVPLRLILVPFYQNEVELMNLVRNLTTFLKHSNPPLTLANLIQQYCEAAKKPFWPCFRGILIRREILPSQIYFESMLACRGLEDGNLNQKDPKTAIQNEVTLEETSAYPQPWLMAASAVVWLFIAIPTMRGPQWIGFFVLFTSFVPVVTNLAVAYYGIQHPGFWEAVRDLFSRTRPICGLKDMSVWVGSFQATTSGMQVGSGVMPVLASYGDFHQDTLAHVFGLVIFFNLFTLLCTFNSVGLTGVLAYGLDMTVEEVRDLSPPAFTFLLYPDLAQVYGTGPLFTICLFFSMVIMGLGTASGLLETIVCHVTEHTNYLTKNRIFGRNLLTILVCCIAFGFGVPFHSRSGMKWYDFWTHIILFALPTVAGPSLFFIAILYGPRKMSKDFGVMFGVKEVPEKVKEALPRFSRWFWKSWLRFYYLITWISFEPVIIAWVIASVYYTRITHKEAPLEKVPKNSLFRFVFMSKTEANMKLVILLCILPCFFVIFLVYRLVSLWCRHRTWSAPFRSSPLWGPAYFVNRRGYDEMADEGTSFKQGSADSYKLQIVDKREGLVNSLENPDPGADHKDDSDQPFARTKLLPNTLSLHPLPPSTPI